MLRFVPVALLTACVSGSPTDKDSVPESQSSSDCRMNMTEGDPGTVLFYDLVVDGLPTLPVPDRLCASADGLRSEVGFSLDGDAGQVLLEVAGVGAYAQGDTGLRELAVEALGASFGATDFFSASVALSAVEGGWEATVLGDATNSSGQQLMISAAWTLPAP